MLRTILDHYWGLQLDSTNGKDPGRGMYRITPLHWPAFGTSEATIETHRTLFKAAALDPQSPNNRALIADLYPELAGPPTLDASAQAYDEPADE